MIIAIETQGLHPATELFLEALQWLQERQEFRHVLDMGCGSGILSVAAASAWDADVLAVDISKKAVADARRNIAANDLMRRVSALRSDGFFDPEIRQRAPYDLILCNLLAELLVSMAPDVKACLAPEGVAILGGMLAWKVLETEAVYKGLDFEIVKQFVINPWHLTVLCHKSAIKPLALSQKLNL